ncbi:MAG: hypothetical protein AB2770_06540 [Candidatus Thiodiazotropha taylori]
MKYLLILGFLFIGSASVSASDLESYNYSNPKNFTNEPKYKDDSILTRIPLSTFNVTQKEVISAALDVTLRNNWNIEGHSKDSIVASYKRSRIELVIEDRYLAIKQYPTFATPNNNWIRSLHKHIEDRIQYYHYMRLINDS